MAVLFRSGNMPILFASSIFLTSIFSCCGDTKSEIVVFNTIDENFGLANKRVEESSEMIYASLDEKRMDPNYSEKVKIWFPKVIRVKELSKEMKRFINQVKTESAKGDHLSKENLEELHNRLMKYKLTILSIDPKIKLAFDTALILTTSHIKLISKNKEEFSGMLIHLPLTNALALINVLHYNINDAENRLLLFLHSQFTYMPICEFYSPIVGQNKSFLRAGEKIEITAGVGSFRNENQMEIRLNGHKIHLESGIAIKSFTASSKPGNHFIPVEIRYLDQDGKEVTARKNIKYTVIEDYKGAK